MEVATLARMHPGRLCPAIGLGMPRWMAEMGLAPPSALEAVRGCVAALRGLLAGEEITRTDGPFTYDHIKLTHPLMTPVPIWMGVSGPAMLRLAGQIADGVVVSVMAGVDYVRWAHERLAEGASQAGRTPSDIGMNVYTFMSVDQDGERARAAVRQRLAQYLAARPDSPLTRAYGIADHVQRLAVGGPDQVERLMPAEWVEDLCVAGNPPECAAKINRLLDAGADAVTLYSCPVERAEEVIRLTGETVLPLIAARPSPSLPDLASRSTSA
jgi:alkanesulfonate monooxygenase SsuD/methylene tetrahydromethanopterin reductase-like flavin-dependent oxidoreductase (luciferase family)